MIQTLIRICYQLGKNPLKEKLIFEIESDDELETTSNPLNNHRHAADESLFIENENLPELTPGQDNGTRHFSF